MQWRTPTGPLVWEHRLIERMIALMREQLTTIDETGTVDPGFIDTATDFIRTYADRCHHGKEEDILFRELAKKDLDPALGADMQGLIADHLLGRQVTGQLVEANAAYRAGDEGALEAVRATIQTLSDFYPVHIAKEDKHFFRPCLAYFTEAEKRAMLEESAEFDAQLVHEKYRTIVAELEPGRP
ncbi:MAG: hemerythrin domain-containing protein [Coriobacteriia bacterium]|nr:hemerythrin domain-containing protein [Coriobacteriia bacterium]